MYIKRINFQGFKNLEGEYLLKKGINLIIKPNGWGKTNFLESIDYISSLRSFRQVPDIELFNWDKIHDFVKIEMKLVEKRSKDIRIVISNGPNGSKKKKVFTNSVATSPKKFKSLIETILYSPHNADIVSSSPEIRRHEFDRLIGEFNQAYSENLNEYKFVVKSRNKLLQKIRISEAHMEELDYWNKRLIDLGQNIIEARVVFLHEIENPLLKFAKNIFNTNSKEVDLRIGYLSKGLENDIIVLRDKISENINKEIQAGMSLYGPHRDKFVFELNNQPLRNFGSRGQQRLAGLSLIFTLYEYFNKKVGRYPILLLDDIMSELDKIHRSNIEKLIQDEIKTQVFLTSSEENYFSKEFLRECNLV